ncbi:MAG: hypothetical protein GY874_00360, partial [Desulfobacteraceae bacterium]|nr:hypothetical protein [Desulfobacteraceae bacterium]
MSITKKLTLISIAGVLILGVLAMTISVQSLNKRGHSEIETMKETLMAEKREKLQDLIGNTYAILEDKYQAAHDTAMVANAYKQQLKSIVEVAYTAVEKIHNDGYLNTLDKQQPAINMIKAMRYQGKDYLWINDTGLKMVMHPVKPALNGKNMSDFKDPEGKYIFREFLKVCQNNGEGFVDYMW